MHYGDDRSASCELLRMIWSHRDGAVMLYSGAATAYGDYDGARLRDGAALRKSAHISEQAATWRLWPVVQQEYGKIGFLSYDAAPPMGMKFSDVFSCLLTLAR